MPPFDLIHPPLPLLLVLPQLLFLIKHEHLHVLLTFALILDHRGLSSTQTRPIAIKLSLPYLFFALGLQRLGQHSTFILRFWLITMSGFPGSLYLVISHFWRS